jgi:hypothetical protein
MNEAGDHRRAAPGPAGEAGIGEVTVDLLCALGRELLTAEQAYRLAPSLENESRLARARRRLDEAVRCVEGPEAS